MSWSVRVYGEGLPDPKEPIASICMTQGSIIMLTKRVGFTERLVDFKTDAERITALGMVIAAVDASEEMKGTTGLFTNEFAVDCDLLWSGGKESRTKWDEWADVRSKVSTMYPMRSYEEYTGNAFRTRVREDAYRFWTYYKLGYTVELTW